MKILVVVDMQNDFIDGVLGTKEAKNIVDGVAAEILKSDYDEVFYTRDTHQDALYLSTVEGRHLPIKHCIKNTDGWEINDIIQKALDNVNVNSYSVDKYHFGSARLANAIREDIGDCEEPMNEIYICGLCTDICVISNAIIIQNAVIPYGAEIFCIEHLCAGTTPESHNAAIETMKSLQINII